MLLVSISHHIQNAAMSFFITKVSVIASIDKDLLGQNTQKFCNSVTQMLTSVPLHHHCNEPPYCSNTLIEFRQPCSTLGRVCNFSMAFVDLLILWQSQTDYYCTMILQSMSVAGSNVAGYIAHVHLLTFFGRLKWTLQVYAN